MELSSVSVNVPIRTQETVSTPVNQDQQAQKSQQEIEKQDEEKNVTSLLKKDVENVNSMLEQHQTFLKFEYYEDLDRYYVKVVDQKTQDVVREIPTKEFLDMIAKMVDYIGLMVDKRA